MRNLVKEHCHSRNETHFVVNDVAYANAESISEIVNEIANQTDHSELFKPQFFILVY